MNQTGHEPRITRRTTLRRLAAGVLAAGSAGAWMRMPRDCRAEPATEVPAMRITKIECVRFDAAKVPPGQWHPHHTWIRLHTDTGLAGTGETYPFIEGDAGMMRELAELVIGEDPRDIQRLWSKMHRRASYYPLGGADLRAISAYDIALWDLLGQAAGLPVYRLLGGKSRDGVRLYNTCFKTRDSDFMKDADVIARSLLKDGIKAMKIWPFDQYANESDGHYLSPADLDAALGPIRKIRDAVGADMEIALEFHSRWDLPAAMRIARAVEPYNPLWIEDMLLQDNMASYARLAAESPVPVCISERLGTRYPYRDMMEERAADIVMYDVTWCGGLSEGRKISDMADTWYLPVAPHTAGGPILYIASLHLAAAVPNLMIMESVRHYYRDFYLNFLEDVPLPENGFAFPFERPGLGLSIRPDIFTNGTATVETLAEV